MKTLSKISTFLDSRRVSLVMWYMTMAICGFVMALDGASLWLRLFSAIMLPVSIDYQRRELNKLS